MAKMECPPVFVFYLHPLTLGKAQEMRYMEMSEKNDLPTDILYYEGRFYKSTIHSDYDESKHNLASNICHRTKILAQLLASHISKNINVAIVRRNDPNLKNINRYTVLNFL